jgi:glycosyltransferase involved in cell wall biosynthesis
MTECRLHLIEFGHYGHRGTYLRELATNWRSDVFGGMLRITVTQEFVRSQPDIAMAISACGPFGVELDVLTDTAGAALNRPWVEQAPSWWVLGSGPPPDSPPRVQWDLAMAAARESGAEHVAFMELDLVLPALAAHLPATSRVTGIWLRPAFHHEGADQRPQWALHEKVMLARSLSHPQLHRIFFMDTQAVESLGRPDTPFRHLPHHVHVPAPSTDDARSRLRDRLDIHVGQVAFLFFGQIARRKGFLELIAAIRLLSSRFCKKLFLIVAGKRDDIDGVTYFESIDALRSAGVGVLTRDEFIDDLEVDALFEACDVVLAPYIRYPGTSDVIVRAAARGRPVLSQDYGVIGRLVRQHRLGIAVDTRSPAAIAAAMTTLIAGDFGPSYDPASAIDFARAHEAAGMAKSFFAGLDLDQTE